MDSHDRVDIFYQFMRKKKIQVQEIQEVLPFRLVQAITHVLNSGIH